MTTLLNVTRKIGFCLTMKFICSALFSLAPGPPLNYEFANNDLNSSFYNIIMAGLPIPVMLTLTGAIKTRNERTNNISIAAFTILRSVVFFFVIVNRIVSVVVLLTENETVLSGKESNPQIIIVKQTIGQEAMGENG